MRKNWKKSNNETGLPFSLLYKKRGILRKFTLITQLNICQLNNNMKRLSFLGLFLISFFCVCAQRPYYRPNIHEVSIQLGAGHYLPGDGEVINQKPLAVSPLNGFRYRYHLDRKSALRFGAFYRRQLLSYHGLMGDLTPTVNWRFFTMEAKVGYERKFDLKKYQIYGGVDAIGTYRNAVVTNPNIDGAFASPQYGGGLFLGFRRYFKEYVSISVENELLFLVNPDKDNRLTPQEIGVNFLQFSFNYHFKRMHKSCACGKPGS